MLNQGWKAASLTHLQQHAHSLSGKIDAAGGHQQRLHHILR